MSSIAVSPVERLSTLPPDDEWPRLTLAPQAVAWAEHFLYQPNGPRAGRKFRFTGDQIRFLAWWYAVDEDGRWLFNRGVRRRAKGSGKSPFAGVVGLIEFCAPVRVHDLDVRKDIVIGKPVDMPLVQIAATAESQTTNTMRMVRAFAPKGSKVVIEHHLDPGKTRYYKLPEGTLEVITSSATAAEGAESTFVIADETEHWKPANGGLDLDATLADNLTKSGSRLLETGIAWVPGDESVAESTWDAWVAQEEGRTRGETRILYDAVVAPPDTDLTDPESLRRALEFVYADCDWKRPHDRDGNPDRTVPPDVRPIMERIWSPKAKVDDSKRKYLGWPTTAADAWTTREAWARLTDATRVVADGEEVALFFDGSKSRDATALIGCCVSDGHVFTIDVWEPAPAHDTDDVVPVGEVDAAVARAFRDYTVVGFFGDVAEWESFVKVEWPGLFAEQLEVKAVPGGKDPQPIAWDMRANVMPFTRAAELCEAEIRDIKFTHDGDSRVARHITNCRRRPNRYGVSVGKETPDSPRKIDAGVCVIGARMVRRQVLAHRASQGSRKRAGRVVGHGA